MQNQSLQLYSDPEVSATQSAVPGNWNQEIEQINKDKFLMSSFAPPGQWSKANILLET